MPYLFIDKFECRWIANDHERISCIDVFDTKEDTKEAAQTAIEAVTDILKNENNQP